jgi:hypothetical protein
VSPVLLSNIAMSVYADLYLDLGAVSYVVVILSSLVLAVSMAVVTYIETLAVRVYAVMESGLLRCQILLKWKKAEILLV